LELFGFIQLLAPIQGINLNLAQKQRAFSNQGSIFALDQSITYQTKTSLKDMGLLSEKKDL